MRLQWRGWEPLIAGFAGDERESPEADKPTAQMPQAFPPSKEAQRGFEKRLLYFWFPGSW